MRFARTHSRTRRALTLVEMLVAMAVTLIMMGSVVTIFGLVGDSIAGSRGTIEISERLRSARNKLWSDLQGVTVTMLPPRRPEADEGYFEYIEGPDTDSTYVYLSPPSPAPFNNDTTGNGLPGDTDDVLMFTSRSRGEPFTGKTSTGSIAESQTAEIVWFTALSASGLPAINVEYPKQSARGTFPLRTLYRRVFLVNPSFSIPTNSALTTFQQSNDISARYFDASNVALNSLGDLTKRENRFAHNLGGFPFPAYPASISGTLLAPLTTRIGEDVILTNVLSFDVKAWDPTAPVLTNANSPAMVPSDPGYFNAGAGATLVGNGAYVDLAYNRTYDSSTGTYSNSQRNSSLPESQFSFDPKHSPTVGAKSQLALATYDTGSLHYEQNGLNEDSSLGTDVGTDTGTNGLDDNNNGVVDEAAEFDTSPPYPVPLRGIQIKIRVFEPDSRQVREVTIVQDFMTQ